MTKRAQLDGTAVARLRSKRISPSFTGKMVTGLAIALLPFSACTADSPTDLTLDGSPSEAVVSAEAVEDFAVLEATDSAITVRWTQVDDGKGDPARYRLKYATPPIDWSSAEIGCEVTGDEVGAEASCTIGALEPSATYDFQLMSHGLRGNSEKGATYSDVLTGATTGPTTSEPTDTTNTTESTDTTNSAEPTDTTQTTDTTDTTDTPDTTETTDANAVTDLRITDATESTLTVRWTEVDDGTGEPARYRLKYSVPSIDYGSAEVGCDLTGNEIGAEVSCTIEGLDAGTAYDVQLMSYRLVEGTWSWEGATSSNVATDDTDASSTSSSSSDTGVWISPAEISALPTSGSAWNNVLSEANNDCGTVDLTDQNQMTNVCIMAKALVFARTGESSYRTDVVTAISEIVTASTYDGSALSLGRELGAYVIAADLIDLKRHDPALDELFRTTLVTLRTTYTTGAASSLIDCHEKRPNNWGAHCGATRAAIAVYLDDTDDLARTAQVFKGYLGDRSSYAGFKYGGPAGEEDLSWQCDETRPVGINPKDCIKEGLSIDGVLPDDQRRGGSFTDTPPKENYVWEALQGLLAQAVILHRAGYPVWDWEDRALLRAAEWLHDAVDYPAEGDDTWQPHVVNHYYGTSFPATTPARAGKNVGWTDWTHR